MNSNAISFNCIFLLGHVGTWEQTHFKSDFFKIILSNLDNVSKIHLEIHYLHLHHSIHGSALFFNILIYNNLYLYGLEQVFSVVLHLDLLNVEIKSLTPMPSGGPLMFL